MYITLPVAFLIIWLSKNYQKKLFERQVQAKLDASSQVQEYLEGMKIIKSCNLSGSHFSALNKALLSMKKIAVKVEMICGVFMSSASMILQAGIGIVIFVGTMLLVKGEIELLPLLMFFLMVAMLGNDDLLAADEMFDNLCDRFENVCNIAGRKFSVNGYEFIGMNYILDHPFGCKDRVVTETHYIPQRQLSPVAGISNAVDYDRIYNWLEYSRTELPHMCDVLKKLPLPDDRQKAVYVMHMPPAGLRLGQLRYQDLDIGSVDIYEFLKEKQPLLSLHGHIHESPDTEKGKWINQIHQTTCIQTGQTELNDKYMVYAEIDLQEKKYERKVISVD